VLREALALWRGPVLADLRYEAWAQAEIRRLEELRALAIEDRVKVDLELGKHAQLVGELEGLVREHPLRERLRAQQMLALYRAGRHADALAAFREARATLDAELGLETGPELRQLEQAILVHDPSLAAPAAAEPGVPAAPPTATFGRDDDMRKVLALLEETRLLTLTGVGGVGKTRLAIEVARAADGRFVSLAATADAERVPALICDALLVTRIPGESEEEALDRVLGRGPMLLALDNLEQMPDAAPLLAGLLARHAGLQLLATSRQPVGIQAERLFPVAPLTPGADVELFADRARARNPGFVVTENNGPAVTAICERLAGLPLAIELAAARLGVLTPADLAARLTAALAVLDRGPQDAPPRQRTLRATLDWSFDLLEPAEQDAFTALGVFAGGCELDAAEAVTGAELDALEGLVAKNLVSTHDGRLFLLEPVRQYAAHRLDHRADADVVRARHLRHYLNLAEAAQYELWARGRSTEGFDRVHRERDNLRAALSWAIERRAVDAVALAGAMGNYWPLVPADDEARRLCRLALEGTDERLPTALEARARHAWAINARRSPEGAEQALAALELYRSLDDQAGIAKCLTDLSYLRGAEGEWSASRVFADEALAHARRSGDLVLIAVATGQLALSIRPFENALSVYRDAARKMRAVGTTGRLAGLLSTGGYTALLDHAYAHADALLADALDAARAIEHPFMVAVVYGNIGLAALLQGRDADAAAAFAEELTLAHANGFADICCYEGLLGLAAVAAQRGHWRRAAALEAAASEHQQEPLEVPEMELLQRVEQRFLAPARERLGDDDWERAGDAGRRLTTEQAIAIALDAGDRPVRG
jgi:predicted ATPase